MILISLVFSNDGKNDPFVASDPALIGLDKSWSSLVGVLVNLIGCAIGHWCLRWRGSDEYNSDNCIGTLNIWKIKDIMKNIQEPMIKYYGIPVYLMPICSMIAVFHWFGKIDPELIEEYGKETVRGFMYNGEIRNVIAGMPDWAFSSIIWFVIATLFGLFATTLWKIEIDYVDDNEDEDCDENGLEKNPSRTTNGGMTEIGMTETKSLSDHDGMEQQYVVTADIDD